VNVTEALRIAVLHRVVDVEPAVVDRGWEAILASAGRERVVGLLYSAVSDGVLEIPAGAARELAERHRAVMAFEVTIDSIVRELAERFAHERLEWRVLKGVATSRLLYAPSQIRQTGDVDVLVRDNDFERAIAIINDLGATVAVGDVPGRRYAAAAPARAFLHPRGAEIDVHRRIAALKRRFTLSESFLFAEPTPIRVAGAEIDTLSPNALFLHACLHLADSNTALSTMADLVRMVHHEAFDTEAALAAARRQRVAGFVDWAIERTSEWTPLPDRVADVRRRHPVGSADRYLARYLQSHPQAARLPDVFAPHRLRILSELLWPSLGFLDSFNRSRSSHIRHMAARFVDLARPRRPRLRSGDDGDDGGWR
jgi:hypothetical protein